VGMWSESGILWNPSALIGSALDKICLSHSHAVQYYSNHLTKEEFLKPYQYTYKVSKLVFIEVAPTLESTLLSDATG
jgi:hypothetical protein